MRIEECCICLEYLNNDLKILQCGHKIHNRCILKMQNSKCPSKYKCPLCREKILSNDMDDYKEDGWRERINSIGETLGENRETINENTERINENRENNIPLPILQLFMFMNPFDNI